MSVLIKQIKPSPDAVLMGLEKEDMVVFPDCVTTMEIPQIYGRPNIGLDKKEDKGLRDEFEKYFNIKFDTNEGQEWLKNYEIVIRHDVTAYDPRNTKDKWDLHLLKVNGGMGIVATSQVAIEESPVNTFKFIITDENAEVKERVRMKETKLAASRELDKLYTSNTNRLVLVAKYLFPTNSGIGSNKVVAFDKLSDFIDKGVSNAKMFLDACKSDPEYVQTVVLVKEAIYRNIIRQHGGQYVLFATQTPLGRNEEEVIKFCSNPNNKDIVGYGLPDDLPTSISAQLKQYLDN